MSTSFGINRCLPSNRLISDLFDHAQYSDCELTLCDANGSIKVRIYKGIVAHQCVFFDNIFRLDPQATNYSIRVPNAAIVIDIIKFYYGITTTDIHTEAYLDLIECQLYMDIPIVVQNLEYIRVKPDLLPRLMEIVRTSNCETNPKVMANLINNIKSCGMLHCDSQLIFVDDWREITVDVHRIIIANSSPALANKLNTRLVVPDARLAASMIYRLYNRDYQPYQELDKPKWYTWMESFVISGLLTLPFTDANLIPTLRIPAHAYPRLLEIFLGYKQYHYLLRINLPPDYDLTSIDIGNFETVLTVTIDRNDIHICSGDVVVNSLKASSCKQLDAQFWLSNSYISRDKTRLLAHYTDYNKHSSYIFWSLIDSTSTAVTIEPCDGNGRIIQLDMTPDLNIIVGHCDADTDIHVWHRVESVYQIKHRIVKGALKSTSAIAISSDNKLIAVIDKTIRLYDVSGSFIWSSDRIETNKPQICFVDNDSKILIMDGLKKIIMHQVRDGKIAFPNAKYETDLHYIKQNNCTVATNSDFNLRVWSQELDSDGKTNLLYEINLDSNLLTNKEGFGHTILI